jgi:hypothetical protein
MIPFGIYEITNKKISLDIKDWNLPNFWDINDLLLIFVHAVYIIMAFTKEGNEYALTCLKLLITIFSFVKLSFLIRIWSQVSFLVRMLIVVFKELLIFLFYFLLVIGFLTVIAVIIIKETGDSYKGI